MDERDEDVASFARIDGRARRAAVMLAFALAHVGIQTPVLLVAVLFVATEDRTDVAGMLRAVATSDSGVWGAFALASAVVAALQWIAVLPLVSRRPPSRGRPRSLAAGLIVAVGVAGITVAGLVGAIAEAVNMLGGFEPGGDAVLLAVLGALALGWLVWAPLLAIHARGLWADRAIGRAAGMIFGGTLVQTACALPIDVVVRRRTDCYCETGTFWSLLGSVAVFAWLAGPGVALLLVRGRFRAWRRTHCARCGHLLGPTPGPRCPECGAARHGAPAEVNSRCPTPDVDLEPHDVGRTTNEDGRPASGRP